MLRRTDVRMIWRGASVREGAELGVDRDKGIDASLDRRPQLLEVALALGNLAVHYYEEGRYGEAARS